VARDRKIFQKHNKNLCRQLSQGLKPIIIIIVVRSDFIASFSKHYNGERVRTLIVSILTPLLLGFINVIVMSCLSSARGHIPNVLFGFGEALRRHKSVTSREESS